ncbi:MAG: protein translocase subunit SecD [Verrucomicrobiota bacterium]|jgi:SecD/SecF fusion protein
MKSNLARLLAVIFVVAWSLYSLYPPKSRNLVDVFQEQTEASDTNFTAIVTAARAMQQRDTNSTVFRVLLDAVGTNDLARYFPSLVDPDAKDTNRAILNALQMKAAGRIKLGLDLQGGISFLVSLDTNRFNNITDKTHAVAQAVEVLRKRVDLLGVAEPLIQPEGENRIRIQLPGLSESDMDKARSDIQRTAFLEFRLVHPDSDQLVKDSIVLPGYEMKTERRKNPKTGQTYDYPYLLKKTPERGLTGKFVDRANVYLDPVSGEPKISLHFNSAGAKIFGDITRENVGKPFAIILDGELKSAPRINEPILGGDCSISGNFDIVEAQSLANVLQNPLEAPVHIEAENNVDPSLGRDSIQSGYRSAIIGMVLVSGFMLVYYLLSGLIANIALVTNIIILLGVMCSVHTTLTLPGIAGIVLTVGMAVDANVLIYERIREELGKGKSLRGAIAAGYDRAFGTIFDSHVTTLISSVILIFTGTGSVKGFGVALTIGVAASLFTSLVVTRLIFNWLLAKHLIKSLPMLHLIRNTKIEFMSVAKIAFTLTWTLIIIGVAWGFHRGRGAMGVDFLGGDMVSFKFADKSTLEVDKLRASLAKAGLNDAQIQFQRDLSGAGETLIVTTAMGTAEKSSATLKAEFPQARLEKKGQEIVGASVGAEIRKSALIAGLLSLFGILVYVALRYEFSFAVGAVVAVIHDVLMTIGCYCLSGREFNATTVAAILTIIGFSTNDTIVIFDRIREHLRMGVRGSLKELMNQALNETLSRTIITSGTVFLATMALFVFGGGAINDFAFTFLVGIVTGTYSSIYIASALVLWWHKGERPNIGAQVVSVSTPTAPVRP